jgi:hypothetical protein
MPPGFDADTECPHQWPRGATTAEAHPRHVEVTMQARSFEATVQLRSHAGIDHVVAPAGPGRGPRRPQLPVRGPSCRPGPTGACLCPARPPGPPRPWPPHRARGPPGRTSQAADPVPHPSPRHQTHPYLSTLGYRNWRTPLWTA